MSQYPPDQRDSIFVVVTLALSPSVPPGLGPIDLLTAVRAPFHVHPPCSYAMLVVHLHLALNRHIAVIIAVRGWTRATGAAHRTKVAVLANTGPNIYI